MITAKLLGTAQDGGVPQLGFNCEGCSDPQYYRSVASLVLLGEGRTLFDATPSITQQLRSLDRREGFPVDRIFLTHLHIGHYLGLLQLGREVAAADNLPVYVSEKAASFIESNKPFSYLIERNQIDLHIFQDNKPISVSGGCVVVPIEVPHRNEDGDTFGFMAKNRLTKKSLFYVPDIDYVSESALSNIDIADITIFDGTFYTKTDIGRQHTVPHPPITGTMEHLGVVPDRKRFIFTHFNHSNPVLTDRICQGNVASMGYEIGYDGMELQL